MIHGESAELALSHRTLPEQVADIIVQGIARGTFPRGERIMESLLIERLKISRPPIREALRILDAQGILIAEPQKGHRVAMFDTKLISDCYEVRRGLEQVSIVRAAQRIRAEPALGGRLREILAEMQEHLKREDFFGMNKADLAFHTEICNLSRNDLLINLWRGLSRIVLIIFSIETEGDRRNLAFEYRQHVDLYNAMINGNAAALAGEIESHLTIKSAAPASRKPAKLRARAR